MFFEILLLLATLVISLVTQSFIAYFFFVVLFLLCLPGILALDSAPYLPTLKKNSETMIMLADISPGTKVYDLGAGDGRLLERAAKKGADVTGFEISASLFLFLVLKKAIKRASWKVRMANFWKKDISDADIVFCFLTPRAMRRFEREKFGTMKKGARLVSNYFPLSKQKEKLVENGVYLYVKK